MVRTSSNFIPLGSSLCEFEMLNTNSIPMGKYNFSCLDERHLLIMFICAHCPFVKYLESAISTFTKEIELSVQTIAISSNDIKNYPEDSPENLKNQAILNGWNFPYLYDEDQSFAKSLRAACTPDFYLFSNSGRKNFSLFYHGQIDSSRPSNDIPINCEDLLRAVNHLNQNKEYSLTQLPSLGCNIKWQPGNEPSWFNLNK